MENNKKSVIKSLAINEKDTGSSEIQIGLLTQKIDKLSKHFKKSKKDNGGGIKAVLVEIGPPCPQIQKMFYFLWNLLKICSNLKMTL